MHGFRKSLAKRLEALERRFDRVPEPETAAEIERRETLIRAALEGRRPDGLAPEEAERFARIHEYAPIFQELIDDGIISPSGEPLGGTAPDHHDNGDGREDAF
jgi:hypothetical protein